MATFVRNRIIQQLSWVPEQATDRNGRREVLCELDGILGQLEEINLRGGVIPARLMVALRRRGIAFNARTSAAELIEIVFAQQERFLRQPEGVTASTERMRPIDLAKRLAS